MKTKIPWYTRKQIEHEFYNYEYYKNELEQIRGDILSLNIPVIDGMPKGGQLNKPTEQNAMELSTSVSVISLEKTISAIEWSLRSLTEEHRVIFDEIYNKGRKDYYALSYDLHISFETLRRRKNELIIAFGLKFGVLKC